MIDRTDDAQREAAEALVVQNLTEAHATEEALVTTLRAHIAMTPKGSYRDLLERHLGETRQQARTIERRLEELGAGRSLVAAGYGLAELVALPFGGVGLLGGLLLGLVIVLAVLSVFYLFGKRRQGRIKADRAGS